MTTRTKKGLPLVIALACTLWVRPSATQIPTPRWSTYDAFRMGIDLPEGAPTSTQERAYTSPIWYAPPR
jgi:hypothetical protein